MTKTRGKQLIIVVTAADIEEGKRGSCNRCPIALSLKRRYPGAHVKVDYDSIEVNGLRKGYITGQIEEWMLAFDTGDDVKPTAFFVDAAV